MASLGRFQRTIVDEKGNIQAGATVTVRRQIGGTPLAQIYSDRAGLTPRANPFTTGSDGLAAFHAIGGPYQITATLGAFAVTWTYEPIGTAQEFDSDALLSGLAWVDVGWATATLYTELQALTHFGVSYRCIADHTSGAANEPGVGASWPTYWSVIAMGSQPGIPFRYSSSTTMAADPGDGLFRLNNATLASVTAAVLDNSMFASGFPAVNTQLLTWDDSTTTLAAGFVQFTKAGDSATFARYRITGGMSQQTGYIPMSLAHIQSAGTFADGDLMFATFDRTGDLGAPAGMDMTFSTTVTMADPGQGVIRYNNATPANVTQIAIDNADRSNVSITGWLDTFDDSNSVVKGYLTIRRNELQTQWQVFRVDSISAQSGYYLINVVWIAGPTLPSTNTRVSAVFVPVGDIGQTGGTGPSGAASFVFSSTTTDADPGNGNLRLNHATPASATAAYIDNNNKGSAAIQDWLDTFDDFGNAALRGQLMMFHPASSQANYRIYNVTGSVVDGTGYRKLTLAHVSGAGSFTNGVEIVISFVPRGATGVGDMTAANNLSDVANKLTAFDNLWGQSTDVASAATVNLSTATLAALASKGAIIDITGVTTITAITLAQGQVRLVRFTGALTLTNGASLETSTGADIVTVAGDMALLVGYASSVVRVAQFFRRLIGAPLHTGRSETLVKGHKSTSFAINSGTAVSSGTVTPDAADSNKQHYTNGGAHTLAPPAAVSNIEVEISNNGSAGAITTSGFAKVVGDAFTTVNGSRFLCILIKSQNASLLQVQALQ